ncbi:hypothetical protein E0K89_003140 [Aquicoccus sp. SCR17]|nr:hypothetical protein [Carideicomes alvinocaridis]
MKSNIIRASVLAGTAAVLTACGPMPSSDMAGSAQGEFFLFRQQGGALAGTYDPAGFGGDEVRRYIAAACTGEAISGYREGASTGGKVAFNATCAQGADYARGLYEVERIGGQVIVEGTVGKNGQMSHTVRKF